MTLNSVIRSKLTLWVFGILLFSFGETTLGSNYSKADSNAHQPTLLPPECETDDPLGMISGSISNWQITASSTYPSSWIKGCEEYNARVFLPNGLAWCAKFKSSSEWLQIDLGVRALVTGIMTQGRGDGSEWVTSFMVSYSDDGTHWNYVTDQYANQKIFEGNTDSFMVKHNYLDVPIKARYVKLHTNTWHNHPSLRVELIGCQPCKQLLGIPPYARYAASSTRSKRAQRSCMPEYGHYLSNKGWCARRQDTHQWLQLDVGPPTQITGLILKGRGDTKRAQYVTRFKLSYSNDTRLWYFYKDATPLDPRLFEGNNEQMLERVHYLASPFTARYVRVHPINWRSKIAMRIGLIGCRQKGPCMNGFFRINNESSCVANLAYKKSAWITPDTANKYRRDVPIRPLTTSYQTNDAHGQTVQRIPKSTPPSRAPMMATHRIRGTNMNYPSTPFWSNGMGHSSSIHNGAGDPVASLAVDGLFNELDEQDDGGNIERNSSLTPRSSEQLMSDDPNVHGKTTKPRVNQLDNRKYHACTVLEYRWPFVELPSWYVDLQDAMGVNGVVIYTGGHGRSHKEPTWKPHTGNTKPSSTAENLERLSVYVEQEPRSSTTQLFSSSTSKLCGFVTRLNDAIYNPRIHIPCRQPLEGRYVYVEARGIRGRWSQEFSAHLCEVMIY